MSTALIAAPTGGVGIAGMDEKRQAALIKAVGWDRVPAEQRELALAICQRYDLDPMLRHVVMIEGKPYITRDGLLWVAHRSGVFDGIEVTDPVLDGGYWKCRAKVYRKDMGRPFDYPGRYPDAGRNTYKVEMAIKVAEVMGLRRAFNVAAPVFEERWDLDLPTSEPERAAPRSLNDKLADRRAAIEARTTAAEPISAPAEEPSGGTTSADHAPEPVSDATAVSGAPDTAGPPPGQAEGEAATSAPLPPPSAAQCESRAPYEGEARCRRESGHEGMHKSSTKESWA